MKITIIGTGYVGLITGVSLAKLGHQVTCVDKIQEKVKLINAGIAPFYEQRLEHHLKQVLKDRLLKASDNLIDSVIASDIIVISVGTPPLKNNKIDLSFIKSASHEIGKALRKTSKYQVVAVKSTVLPGVTENIVNPILEKESQKKVGEFGLCMNPEFLREGNAIEDALHPDRIVIGQIDKKSGKEYAKIYANVKCEKIFTDLATAELIKYTSNSLLATLISFSNEISRIAEGVGNIDVMDVWKGVHSDRRLSPFNGHKRIRPGLLNYIVSGCGFGGSCFPKDIKALNNFAKQKKIGTKIINGVIEVNRTQPHQLILHLKKVLGEDLKNKRIAVLGLSFKPETDDIRESPALSIIHELISQGVEVTCHDPEAYKKCTPENLTKLPAILAKNIQGAVKGAEAVILVTAWSDYMRLTPKFFKENMKIPIVIDGRRIYDKETFIREGVIYTGIGL